MADIIRTWPASVETRAAAAMFNEEESAYGAYFFALGKNKPKQPIERVWFTFRGRIVGFFAVTHFVVNDGSMEVFDHLNKACGEGNWHIPRDYWTCICESGFTRAPLRRFMSGFRGWRYFNFDEYADSPAGRFRHG